MVSATGYYPFGMAMPGRTFSSGAYRYGFNGKEDDKDITNGAQDYGMRIYDKRLGRFLSVDPLAKTYPHFTPYQFSSNNPILNVDLDGLEGIDYLKNVVVKMDGNSVFPKSDLKNTDYNKVFVIMNGKTANIIHNTPSGVTTIEFNPSSAPSPGKLWFRYGFDQLIAANDYSKKWVGFTDSKLPSMINKATGSEQNAGGFANTFRHYSWQSLLTAGFGEKFANDIADYHEADGLGQNEKVSAQKYNGYIKDNIIDIVNNHYAKEYGKTVDFKKVTSSVENYTDFLNGVAQHIASTVDGYKNDKAFDGIRNGTVKVFDKNNEAVKEQFQNTKAIRARYFANE